MWILIGAGLGGVFLALIGLCWWLNRLWDDIVQRIDQALTPFIDPLIVERLPDFVRRSRN